MQSAEQIRQRIATDVFVDVGSGVGRAMALVHLLTGAAVIGIENLPLPECAWLAAEPIALGGVTVCRAH